MIGIKTYPNIFIGNIHSIDFIIDILDRYIVHLFRESNIKYCLKLKNQHICDIKIL